VFLAVCVTCALTAQDEDMDFSFPEPLGSVLSDEPESARMRFQAPLLPGTNLPAPPSSTSTSFPGTNLPAPSSGLPGLPPMNLPSSSATSMGVTFDDTSSLDTNALSALSNPLGGEFDGQIEEVQQTINKLKGSIKESQECANRLAEQRAQYRSLQSQLDHLQREKEKKILEDKLQRQMRDLDEINHMSRSLRQKYNELKRTQQLIRTRMTGTKTSLSQLDEEDAETDDSVVDNGSQIASEMDAMHQMQAKILEMSHFKNSKAVRDNIELSDKMNQQNLEAQGLAKPA